MSEGGGEADSGRGLAPVIPLFGDRGPEASAAAGRDALATAGAPGSSPDTGPPPEAPTAGYWHTSWVADEPAAEPLDDEPERVEAAEAALMRKLRGRSLSIREARTVLGGHDLDAASVEAVVTRFVRNGYLDDARLADQLIHTAVERKGQGRRVVAQALAQRGIGREVIDEALADLPDDDAERALEFARQKARTMTDLDHDVALRRLAGQLARRGYGAQALDAARRALDEAGSGRGGRSGVRFR